MGRATAWPGAEERQSWIPGGCERLDRRAPAVEHAEECVVGQRGGMERTCGVVLELLVLALRGRREQEAGRRGFGRSPGTLRFFAGDQCLGEV